MTQDVVTPPAIGRDHRNLLYMPIGVIGKNQPIDPNSGEVVDELVRSVVVYDEDVGKPVEKSLSIRTSSRFKFCTGYDLAVIPALLTLHYLHDGFASPQFPFKNEDLYDLMKWTKHSGKNNIRLEQSLDRINGSTLTFHNMWSSDGGRTFQKKYSTRIFDSYQFVKTSDGGGSSWVRWSEAIYTDITEGNVKPLNSDEFFSLTKPQAQTAYRILDEAFQNDSHFEMDLMVFATRLGMTTTKAGKVRDAILSDVDPALMQLGNFIEPADKQRRFKGTRGSWRVVYDCARSAQLMEQPAAALRAPQKASTSKQSFHPDARAAVSAFYEQYKRLTGWEPTVPELRAASTELLAHYDLATVLQALKASVKRWKKGPFQPEKFTGATHTLKEECLRTKNRDAVTPVRRPVVSNDTSDKRQRTQWATSMRQRFDRLSSAQQEQVWESLIKQAESQTYRNILGRARSEQRELPHCGLANLEQWLKAHNLLG